MRGAPCRSRTRSGTLPPGRGHSVCFCRNVAPRWPVPPNSIALLSCFARISQFGSICRNAGALICDSKLHSAAAFSLKAASSWDVWFGLASCAFGISSFAKALLTPMTSITRHWSTTQSGGSPPSAYGKARIAAWSCCSTLGVNFSTKLIRTTPQIRIPWPPALPFGRFQFHANHENAQTPFISHFRTANRFPLRQEMPPLPHLMARSEMTPRLK